MGKSPRELELEAEIERLMAVNNQNKQAGRIPEGGITSIRVSPKKAVSVYGLMRWPVTLYREQWEKLAAMMPEILQFIKDHDSEIKRKPVEGEDGK